MLALRRLLILIGMVYASCRSSGSLAESPSRGGEPVSLRLRASRASFLPLDRHTHRPRRALDDPHRGLDGLAVEVGHLLLGDLLDLGLGDLADLFLVGDARALFLAGRLENEGAGGAGLDLELEGAVV